MLILHNDDSFLFIILLFYIIFTCFVLFEKSRKHTHTHAHTWRNVASVCTLCRVSGVCVCVSVCVTCVCMYRQQRVDGRVAATAHVWSKTGPRATSECWTVLTRQRWYMIMIHVLYYPEPRRPPSLTCPTPAGNVTSLTKQYNYNVIHEIHQKVLFFCHEH